MPLGEGEYDGYATHIREETKAAAVLLVVLDGDRGTGLSLQCGRMTLLTIPDLLREIANDFEKDIQKMARESGENHGQEN